MIAGLIEFRSTNRRVWQVAVLFVFSGIFSLALSGYGSFMAYFALVPLIAFFTGKNNNNINSSTSEITNKNKRRITGLKSSMAIAFLSVFAGLLTGLVLPVFSFEGTLSRAGALVAALFFSLFFMFKLLLLYSFRNRYERFSLWRDTLLFCVITFAEIFIVSRTTLVDHYTPLFPFVKTNAVLLTGLIVLVNGIVHSLITKRSISLLVFPVTLFLAFPSYETYLLEYYGIFALFAFVPLCFAARDISLKKVYSRFFLVAFAANALTYGWMGSFGNSVPYGDLILLSVFIPTLSVILATKFTLAEYLARRYPDYRLFIFPVVLLAVDFLQSWGYLAFPWTYIGYSQFRNDSMLFLSSITGIFGVIFLLYMVNTIFADILYRFNRDTTLELPGSFKTFRAHYAVLAVAALIFTVPGFLLPAIPAKTDTGRLRAALVQTCISPWDNWELRRHDFLKTLTDETDRALEEGGADLVIWSESATLETVSYSYRSGRVNRFVYDLLMYARERKVPIFTAEIGLYRGPDGFYYTNSACIVSAKGRVDQVYDKIHLAPIGEWFPYHKLFPGLQRFLESMGSSSFVPGTKPVLMEVDGFKFGPLICYEGMFHRLNRRYRKMGADFLVNITNDGWSDYYSGHMQHYAASPFRAAENGIWYLRVGNTGYTVIIDPYGREVASIPIMKVGHINESVPVGYRVDTIFSRIGDTLIYLLFLGAVIIMLASETGFLQKHRHKNS
jgi:apolipoprotein N-acyltransferase